MVHFSILTAFRMLERRPSGLVGSAPAAGSCIILFDPARLRRLAERFSDVLQDLLETGTATQVCAEGGYCARNAGSFDGGIVLDGEPACRKGRGVGSCRY